MRKGLHFTGIIFLLTTGGVYLIWDAFRSTHDDALVVGPQNLNGHLLIAAPEMPDPRFTHSVVLIVSHDASGAMGLIINRETARTIAHAWNETSQSPCLRNSLVRHGGPVASATISTVHTNPALADVGIADNLFLSTNKNAIASLVSTNAGNVLFFMGHASWQAGQLEAEIHAGLWQTIAAQPDHVFSNEPDSLWKNLMKELNAGWTKWRSGGSSIFKLRAKMQITEVGMRGDGVQSIAGSSYGSGWYRGLYV